MQPGWLWLQEMNGCAVEILNENRVNAYGQIGPFWNGESSAACRPHILDYDPCNLLPSTYTTPDDVAHPAPWYDVNDPASGRLLGFQLSSITGLDGAHWSRAVLQRTNRGANVSSLRAGSREMAFEVWVYAKDRQGLEYGRRWLEYQLAATCDPCMDYTAFVRLFAQDVPILPTGVGHPTLAEQAAWNAEMRRGLYMVNGVSMLQGPQWAAPPMKGAESSLQALTFVLAASSPCLTTCPVSLVNQVTNSGWAFPVGGGCYTIDQWLCGPQTFFGPLCFPVASGPLASQTALQVQIDAPLGAPRMLVGLLNNYSIDCDGTPCSQIVLDHLPAGASVIVDGATEQILYRPLADSPWQLGDFLYVHTTDTFTDHLWPKFSGCGTLGGYVQPWSLCGLNPSIAVSASMQHVEGCV